MEGQLTIFFENRFGSGCSSVRTRRDRAAPCVVFGAEPTDVELYEYIRREYASLDFSKPIANQVKIVRKKRLSACSAVSRKTVYAEGIGTKAQQAIKLQTELNKTERQVKSREQQEAEKALKFKLKQEKKKEKHRGH